MGMNRRNVLVGLGGLTVGGGALFASGAFTTVEAQRTVSVEATGDATALLAMRVSGAIASEEGNTIAFDLEDDVNLDARTTFEEALEVTNNGDEEIELDILDDFDGDSLLGDGSTRDLSFEGHGSDPVTVASDDSVEFDIVFDIEATVVGEEDIPDSIVIEATQV